MSELRGYMVVCEGNSADRWRAVCYRDQLECAVGEARRLTLHSETFRTGRRYTVVKAVRVVEP